MRIPRLESLIILIFFGCVALWGISKCSGKRAEIGTRLRDLDENIDAEDRPRRRDTVFVPQNPAPVQQTTTTTTPGPNAVAPTQPGAQRPVVTRSPSAAPTTTPTSTSPTATQPAQPSGQKYSTLYVTIDGLKLRKEPTLKSDVVAKLELYEPVYFLNQKTEKTEEINLGYEKVTDHWVKVRTKAGKEGWVFGAGVHYYKMKRKGVME
ncbi:MAG: SH3 domain-containing protein [Saprospiraceae bacterium]|nr:SH3 domain-containing protein [Saprospiraceae bacterium]